jgi:hypothetical protein
MLERIEPSVKAFIEHVEQHSDYNEPSPDEPVIVEEEHGED